METITLNINGQEVKTKKGKTVLQAALDAGIYIPTVCHHPDLTPYGACRLCIVEIEGMRGLPTACTTPATEGMVVRTETPQITQTRRSVLELMLAEHPNACLTCHRRKHCGPGDICLRHIAVTDRCVLCPKNEHCELQDVALYIGIDEVSFGYTSRGLPIKRDEPLFTRDYNLCILCGRCVQMCQEVRGINAIAFTQRGSQALVGTAYDRPLMDSGCKFCLACVEVCPTAALMDKTDGWKTEAERETFFVPCRNACPLGIDVPRYVRFIAEGRFAEALAVNAEKTPFPTICGTVCHHPCEAACRRNELNQPIAIRALKRFVAERAPGGGVRQKKSVPPSSKRVAIVGSGPAGLTAAYYLAKLGGHSVTVFEALPEPGGMLRYGIPEYRLPKRILDAEICLIKDVGAEIKTNTKIDSLDELFAQGYNAVFMALGAHQGTRLGVDGEDSPGVVDGVTLLRNVTLGEKMNLGDKVAVIGGGNVAMDSARTALRLGAKEVTVIYRRTQAEMPAAPEEIEEAHEEGVKMVFLAAPVKISRKDGQLQLTSIRMELGEPDASGRRRPVPVKGSEFTMDFNTIVTAIGQVPEIPKQLGLETDRGNILKADPKTLATKRQGVFAGGDVVSGPATVTEAIAAGRKAAISIDEFLGGSGNINEVLAPQVAVSPCLGMDSDFSRESRQKMPCLELDERLDNFAQVELGFDEEVAVAEASRCLKCDLRLSISPVKLPPKKCASVSGEH